MRFVMIQILSFALIFALLFSLARIIMGFAFLSNNLALSHLGEGFKMLSFGAYSDIRVISAALLPLLLCAFLCLLSPLFSLAFKQGGGL
ncbi:hypothetical protein OQH61_06055 [Helicobacter sp. MIT 21-1697]|uniref:hypothetical protein n=1 Tax=Helicobacter sp. MIT 21-1697 TaxID=2993733 RepID=UPI00224AB3DD|nr:hypothetical protein [Helicobacter sp. MIT 21-1697]MCX2717297.1 hypothetical protein [Helicobacter sp. MIT 21-1697]